MAVSANQIPPELSEKRNLLGFMFFLFFVIYPVASIWYSLCTGLDGAFLSEPVTFLGKTDKLWILCFTVPLMVGYCITESVMLFRCHVWNTDCTIFARSLISIHDILLIIVCIIDWKNDSTRYDLAIFTFVFSTTLVINCTILFTIVRFPRKGSSGNLLSSPRDNTE